MKKFLILAITLITALSLFSCSEDDVPDGMQLVSGGEDKGYYFYGPEEWTVSNVGKMDAIYASALDNSSMTFTEIDPQKLTPAEGQTKSDYFFNNYFQDSLKEFPDSAKLKITVNGKEDIFGAGAEGADKAVRYVYEYTYDTSPFGFIQIFLSHDDNFYIFTYSAQKTKRVETEESTRYDFYMDKLTATIESFRFVKKAGASSDTTQAPTDSDGFILASDKKKAGFDFYVPQSFKVDYSSAITSATHSDGSNVNMTIATRAGIPANDYWSIRRDELSTFVTNLTVIQENVNTKLGNNSQWAFAYEYTYEYNGEKYHVYQILAVDGMLLIADGYVFTYTAKEENYEKHFDDVEKSINKVVF